MFPLDLVEGSSIQVLCGITSGDKPVYFSWLKDGQHIPTGLQVYNRVYQIISTKVINIETKNTKQVLVNKHCGFQCPQSVNCLLLSPVQISLFHECGNIAIGHDATDNFNTCFVFHFQVQEKSLDEFSFLIFSHVTSKHSGDYTCVASNSAAEVNHTARLAVKGWTKVLFYMHGDVVGLLRTNNP